MVTLRILHDFFFQRPLIIWQSMQLAWTKSNLHVIRCQLWMVPDFRKQIFFFALYLPPLSNGPWNLSCCWEDDGSLKERESNFAGICSLLMARSENEAELRKRALKCRQFSQDGFPRLSLSLYSHHLQNKPENPVMFMHLLHSVHWSFSHENKVWCRVVAEYKHTWWNTCTVHNGSGTLFNKERTRNIGA